MATILYIVLPIMGWIWLLIKIAFVWGTICSLTGITISILEEVRQPRWDTSGWKSHTS